MPVVVVVIYPDLHLSPREREVVRLLCRDMSNEQIGVALGITAATVATHIVHIKRRLDVEKLATRAAVRGAFWRSLAGVKA